MPKLDAKSAEGGKTRGYRASGLDKTRSLKLTDKTRSLKLTESTASKGCFNTKPPEESEVRCSISMGRISRTSMKLIHVYLHAFQSERPLLICQSKAHIEVAYHANPGCRVRVCIEVRG